MKPLITTLAILAISSSALFAGETPSISKADLKTAIAEKKVVIIDVNGTESYDKAHIPGALDFAAVKTDLAAALPADKGALVVAYCGSEACGAYKQATQAAEKLGYTNVQHFSGGIKGWVDAGEPTEMAAQEKMESKEMPSAQ